MDENMGIISQLLEHALNAHNFQKTVRGFMAKTGHDAQEISAALEALAELSGDEPISDLDELEGLQ